MEKTPSRYEPVKPFDDDDDDDLEGSEVGLVIVWSLYMYHCWSYDLMMNASLEVPVVEEVPDPDLVETPADAGLGHDGLQRGKSGVFTSSVSGSAGNETSGLGELEIPPGQPQPALGEEEQGDEEIAEFCKEWGALTC